MAAFLDDPAAAGYSKREILLAQAGWIKPNLQANDNRQVAPLNPTMTLHQVRKQRLATRQGAKGGGGPRVNWSNKEAAEKKFQEDSNAKKKSLREMVMKKPPQAEDSSDSKSDSVPEENMYQSEVEKRFMENVMSDMALGGPAAAQARSNLAQKNPALLAKMMARMDKEDKKAEIRGRKLNSLGILDEEVNDVRNRNMQRVSLRKGLTGAALAKEHAPTVDPLAGVVSLEERLSELLEVVTLVVDGPPDNESKSMFDTNLAGAAARMVMAQRQGMTPARQHELEAITSKALGRYRQRVHEEQVKLLEEMGLNLQQPDSWVDTLEQREEQRLEEEAEAEMEKHLPSNTAANTEELMDAVLNRLAQIEERMAAHEELVKQQEAAKEGSEKDSDDESQGGYDPRGHTTDGRSSRQQIPAERSQTSVQKNEEEDTTDPFDDGLRPRKLPHNWAPGGVVSKSQSGMRSIRQDRSGTTAHGPTGDGSHPGPSGPSGSYGATFYFPDEDELASAPAPSLPAVMQLGGMTPADVLQTRLERIWGLLEMPMMGKLDMVIKYTAKELSPQLEEALEIWESGAASVVERERLLSMMVDIQESMDSGTIAKSIVNKKSVSEVCMGFLYMSYNARRADSLLRSMFQDCLTYQGLEYPGEDAVTDDQLETFVQRAFDMSVQLSTEGVLV